MRGTLTIAVALLLVDCGSAKTACDATSCQGCCASDGVCHSGRDDTSCGSSGAACVDCTSLNATCTSIAVCLAGGSGGGSAQGGGTNSGGGDNSGGGTNNGGGSNGGGTSNAGGTAQGGGTNGGGSGGGSAPLRKRVFVTSMWFGGNLKMAGNGTTGLDGADKLCNTYAQAATLGGTWRAWVSTSTVDAIDHIVDVSPWYLVDRTTLVFANHAQLAVHGMAAIDHNEMGAVAASTMNDLFEVWTGTGSNGRKTGGDCNDWTMTSMSAELSTKGNLASAISSWTDQEEDYFCNYGGRLYCFEQ